MFHVAIIVAAYGFFGVSCLMGLTNMVLMIFAGKKRTSQLIIRIKELSIINEMVIAGSAGFDDDRYFPGCRLGK